MAAGKPGATEAEALNEADTIALAKYAPAGVVVNSDLRVLQFRGATGRYLEPMPGKATIGELESFSYSVSHDMRAPLRAMLSFAEIIKNDYQAHLGDEGAFYLNRIVAAAHRLDQLVRDILTYSRTVRTDLRLEQVDLEGLVDDAVRDNAEWQPPRATIEIQHPLLPVTGHPAALMQCIANLLSNAAKFVSHGVTPKIRIWTEPIDGRVRVWFQDNGIGIAPEDVNRIFGLFERIHSDAEFEGTGVGLAIVKKAVERMGGTIGVQSEPGHGSRFWIELSGVKD